MKRAIAFSVCIAFATPASAAELGRLFFTPGEREQLDLARIQKKAPPAPAATQSADVPVPEIVTYGGIIRRSDGRAMLWINNHVADEREALGALSLKGSVRPDGAVTLQVPQSGGTIEMKVGQSVDLQSGRVAEGRKAPPSAKSPNDPNADAADTKTAAASSTAKPAANEDSEKKRTAEPSQKPATPLEKEHQSGKDAAQK